MLVKAKRFLFLMYYVFFETSIFIYFNVSMSIIKFADVLCLEIYTFSDGDRLGRVML